MSVSRDCANHNEPVESTGSTTSLLQAQVIGDPCLARYSCHWPAFVGVTQMHHPAGARNRPIVVVRVGEHHSTPLHPRP